MINRNRMHKVYSLSKEFVWTRDFRNSFVSSGLKEQRAHGHHKFPITLFLYQNIRRIVIFLSSTLNIVTILCYLYYRTYEERNAEIDDTIVIRCYIEFARRTVSNFSGIRSKRSIGDLSRRRMPRVFSLFIPLWGIQEIFNRGI